MSLLPHFHLPPASREHFVATGPSAPFTFMHCLDFRVPIPIPDESEGTGSSHDDMPEESDTHEGSRGHGDMSEESDTDDVPDNAEAPATSRKKGSFYWDREKGGFTLEWENLAEFDMWRWMEESMCSIQFVLSHSQKRGIRWSEKVTYVCSRQNSRGRMTYEKKYPERHRKIKTKKTGCGCHIVIKQYHHTPTVLRSGLLRAPIFFFLSRPLSFSHPLPHLLLFSPTASRAYLPFVVSFPPPCEKPAFPGSTYPRLYLVRTPALVIVA